MCIHSLSWWNKKFILINFLNESFAYIGSLVSGETHETNDVYEMYRSLDVDYRGHVGTVPIQMPEAGRLIADCGNMMVLDPLLKRPLEVITKV